MSKGQALIELTNAGARLDAVYNVTQPHADWDADAELAENQLHDAAFRYVNEVLGMDPLHVYEVGNVAIAVQHPLTCQGRAPGKTLLHDCPEGRYALSLGDPPADPGYLYYADWDEKGGRLENWRKKAPMDEEV